MSVGTRRLLDVQDDGLDIYSLCGMQKGIQFYKNSCYVDATLMLLFYTHGRVDLELDKTSPLYDHLVPIINSIRSKPFYCSEEYTTNLRNCIETGGWLGKIGIGDLMDAEEFIRKIFPLIFKRGFIYYQENVPNFVHCVINYNTVKIEAQFLSEVFKTSMSKQGLDFATFPHPLLMIKTPYCGGKLVGYDYVVPDLSMIVTSASNDDESRVYELTGVMSYRGSHFVAYMRKRTEAGYKWLYYNSTSHNDISMVINCDSLEENLLRLKEEPSKFFHIIKSDLALADLCKTSFLVFYAPPSSQSKVPEFSAQHNTMTSESSSSISQGFCARGHPSRLKVQVNRSRAYKIPTVTSSHAKVQKPADELDVTTAGTPSFPSSMNELAPSEEISKHVVTRGMQLFSIAIYAFADCTSPFYRWIRFHACSDCHSAGSKCLPGLVYSYSDKINLGKFKNIQDLLNSSNMLNARINWDILGDASGIFKLLLHIFNVPQFIKGYSGNIYQMELPAADETCVRTMAEKLLRVDVDVDYSLIVARESFHNGGIIPSEEIGIKSKSFKLYGVICKCGDEYSLYTIQATWALIRKQFWGRVTYNAYSDDAPFQIKKVITDRISCWAENTPNPHQTAIMFRSQVWVYSPAW